MQLRLFYQNKTYHYNTRIYTYSEAIRVYCKFYSTHIKGRNTLGCSIVCDGKDYYSNYEYYDFKVSAEFNHTHKDFYMYETLKRLYKAHITSRDE